MCTTTGFVTSKERGYHIKVDFVKLVAYVRSEAVCFKEVEPFLEAREDMMSRPNFRDPSHVFFNFG